jgi:hypothetical protein
MGKIMASATGSLIALNRRYLSVLPQVLPNTYPVPRRVDPQQARRLDARAMG